MNWAVEEKNSTNWAVDEVNSTNWLKLVFEANFFILYSLLFIIFILTKGVEHYIILLYNNG